MVRTISLALVLAAATFAVVGASPAYSIATSKQAGAATTGQETSRPTRVLNLPAYPTAYVTTVAPKDPRTPHQKCFDDEVAKAGGAPSDLALASIDLKCSQR